MTEVIWAPAKLTVSLHVVGRRDDGYHLLDAEMVTLDLADRLEISAGATSLSMEAQGHTRAENVSIGDDNLVVRALNAVQREARIVLHKSIPVGGGLGGGSADAGAILRWAGGVTPAVAARLGADVPFCMSGGRARVEGIGEVLTPLPFLARSFTLLVPPVFVDTAAVYRAHDALVDEGNPLANDVVNDLSAAALVVAPELGRWRSLFAEAAGSEVHLAGSGSTWWVEGHPDALLGLETLRLDGVGAPLFFTDTVPQGWQGPTT